MRAFLVAVVLITCCLLQALAAKFIPSANIRFELALIAVIFYSLRMEVLSAALVGITGGLIKDALSSATFGVSAMAFFMLAIILSWNRRVLSARSPSSQALLVATTVVLYCFIDSFIDLFLGSGPFPNSFVLRYIIPLVIVNAIIAPVIFRILGYIDHEMA